MYYRRKVLLALISAFGGVLSNTDCQKLLFLFCQRSGNDYYDFFPYLYGGFSHVLYDDKRHLTQRGLLREDDKFEIITQKSWIDELKPEDQRVLKALTQEVGTTRSRRLVRKVYLEFPYYASRSEIAEETLNPTELARIANAAPKEDTPCLFTVGYEGISVDAYLNKLILNNIHALIDVRKNPLSRKYGFSKSKLQSYVERLGIHYFHLPELGIASHLRKNLDGPESYRQLFELYTTEILPHQEKALKAIRDCLAQNKRIALTCFEASHLSCHRHKITERLENDVKFKPLIVHL